jgi:hypothetical protein
MTRLERQHDEEKGAVAMQNTQPIKRAPWPGEARTGADKIRRQANQLAIEGLFDDAQTLLDRSRADFLELGDVEWTTSGPEQLLKPTTQFGILQLNSEAELLRLKEIARLKAADPFSFVPDFTQAASGYHEALKCSLRLLGHVHPLTGIITGNLGLCYQQANRVDLASVYLHEALVILSEAAPFGIYTLELIASAVGEFERALSLI